MKKEIVYNSILVVLATIILTGCANLPPDPLPCINSTSLENDHLKHGNMFKYNSNLPHIPSVFTPFKDISTMPVPERIDTDTTTSCIPAQKIYNSYDKYYIEYLNFQLNFTKCSFWTQYVLSIVIFILVVAIVSIGIILSWKQFNNNFNESVSDVNNSIKNTE